MLSHCEIYHVFSCWVGEGGYSGGRMFAAMVTVTVSGCVI